MFEKLGEIIRKYNVYSETEIEKIVSLNNWDKIKEKIMSDDKINFKELNIDIMKLFIFESDNIFEEFRDKVNSDKLDKYDRISGGEASFEERLEKLSSDGVISESFLKEIKSKKYKLKICNEDEIAISTKEIEEMGKFDVEFIRENKFFILKTSKEKLTIGILNNKYQLVNSRVVELFNVDIEYVLISSSIFESLFNDYLNKQDLLENIKFDSLINSDQEEMENLKNEDNPIVILVHNILKESVRKNSSDIHIEPFEEEVKIKNRIDGVLIEEKTTVSKKFLNMIISRIKILSKLNIAEHRIPQDGRFQYKFGNHEVDFRVSILPTIFGESAVLRILDKKQRKITLESLGIEKEDYNILEKNAMNPNGLIIVSGPTGSGKTTTLYAVLNQIKRASEKVVTIEDPIEYQLNDIIQIPVNEKTGLTFAKGLRAILRQDPDKIMVGEIRDKETAEIAIQAALTGHLVLTTLHSNNTVEAIGRLTNIGVDSYQLATAIRLIIGQRLMRKVCQNCGGKGCVKCFDRGYNGRQGVFELFELNSDIREMIIEKNSAEKIRMRAIEDGMVELEEKGKRFVEAGLSNIAEYERVFGKW